MIDKIVQVEKGELLKMWSQLASLLWSSNAQELEQDFLQGKYLNEFLYFLNGEAVAFLSLSLRQEYVEGAKSVPVAYIEGIFVQRNYREKGIASKLINFAKAWAKENCVKELASNCSLENEDSQLFHQKVGFKEVNKTVNFILPILSRSE